MDKQNVVYVYNGALFSHKKEEIFDTCYNMVEPQKYYAKWKKINAENHVYMKCPEKANLWRQKID